MTFFIYRLITHLYASTTPTFRHRLSSVLTKFNYNFLFGCHPMDGVNRGGPPPPQVTPLVDVCRRHDDHGHGASRRLK